MRKAALLAVMLLSLAGGAAARPVAAAPAAGSLFPAQSFPNVATPTRTFDLLQMVVDYDAGAASQDSAQSARFFTVMEGELSITAGGKTDVYGVGKGTSASAGLTATLTNNGSKKARLYLSALVPAWDRGPQLAAVSSAPASKTVFSGRYPFKGAPGRVNLHQAGVFVEPGYSTPNHVMLSPHAFLVTAGTESFDYLDGGSESYVAGQTAEMYVCRPRLMANKT